MHWGRIVDETRMDVHRQPGNGAAVDDIGVDA
jgi:hypothetical protein